MHLEELVRERTKQLSLANARLRSEVKERQQAEQELRKNQERLAMAMDISGAAEFEIYPQQNISITSDRFNELNDVHFFNDIPYSEALNEWSQRIPEQDKLKCIEQSDKILRGDIELLDVTFSYTRPDGKSMYQRQLARAVEHDEEGKATRIVGVAMDVTSQLRARQLMELQRDLGIALNTATTLQQAAAITLDALAPYQGLDIFVVYAVNDEEHTLQVMSSRGVDDKLLEKMDNFDGSSPQYKMLRQGIPFYSRHNELSALMVDDTRSLQLQAVAVIPMIFEKNVVGAIYTGSRSLEHMPQDIRYILEAVSSQAGGVFATIKAQEALRASEAKYRNLIDTIPHGLIEFDRQGRILFCNQVIADRHGMDALDMIGDNITEYIALEKDRERFRNFLQRIQYKRPQPQPFFFSSQHIDGFMIDLQADWNYNLDEDDNLISFTSVVTDITARKVAEEALQKARDELELRVEERTRELHWASEQLRRLATRQGEIIEQERKRIAREIHDELGQNLTALNMGMSVLGNMVNKENTQALTRVDVLRSTLEQMINSVQRICQELRPMQLDDLGLSAAIAWRINDFQKTTGLRTILTLEPEEFEAAPEIATAVYRLVQEALTNAARHAQADTVWVDMVQMDHHIQVTIKDNGKGISPAAMDSPNSFGLLGMYERLHAVNGTLDIKGESGKGTTVTACLPLSQRADENVC